MLYKLDSSLLHYRCLLSYVGVGWGVSPLFSDERLRWRSPIPRPVLERDVGNAQMALEHAFVVQKLCLVGAADRLEPDNDVGHCPPAGQVQEEVLQRVHVLWLSALVEARG